MTAESTATLNSLLNSAQTVCVFFPANAPADVVLSAVSFGRGVASLGKQVTISTPKSVEQNLLQFDGVAEVTSELGNKNLDVSFPYHEEQVDKVSYHIDEEEQRFHLVVQPKKGQRPLDSTAVQFSLIGAEADVIVTFGVNQLEQLDQLFFGYEELFQTASVISINSYETNYGTLKLSTEGAASYGEVVAYVLQELQVTIDPSIATNLLAAIEAATQTFRSLSVTAQTFEIAGKLLSAGARRMRVSTISDESTQQQSQHPKQAGSFAAAMGKSTPSSKQGGFRPERSDRDKQKPKDKRVDMPSGFGGVSRS